MTRYAVFGAEPIWGLELDADVSRAVDSRGAPDGFASH